MDRFVQTFEPRPDPYESDWMVRTHLARLLGSTAVHAEPALRALAADVSGPLLIAHADAEAHPPRLVQYDPWGARIDRIETAAGWETQRRAAATHGIVALPYSADARSTFGSGARVLQHAFLHLYGPESATFSCPVAMADGAAALLHRPEVDPAVRDAWLPRLVSTDPTVAITSGQWMTETAGGSDVGRTGTTAAAAGDGSWRLTGEKWFCSATDSAMAVALARPEGAPDGSAGLAPFLIPRYAADSPLAEPGTDPTAGAPGLLVHRLKDKLGTRGLPSAEVGLHGAYALPIGDPAAPGGVARMMTLVTVTRVHNAAAATGGMSRGLLLARQHARTREVFGVRLDQQPLHRETLGWLAVDTAASYALTALCFSLLGRLEVDGDEAAGGLLRLAATLAKATTGKLAVASASEYVECFGGNGFIEDTGIPRLIRDAQVLPIWEGTTNVLAMDVLRALRRDDPVPAFLDHLDAAAALADSSSDTRLVPLAAELSKARADLADRLRGVAHAAPDQAAASARALTLRMGHALAGAALLEQAAYDVRHDDPRSALAAELWIRRRLSGQDCEGDAHRHFTRLVDGVTDLT